MWKFFQSDKNGTPAEFEDGMQIVTNYPCPPLLPQKTNIFSQKFTVDGKASGSDDLGVDGSATHAYYYIPANKDKDRYITRISFVMGYGTAGELFEFADSGAALTNGVKVSYFNSIGEETNIMNPKSNYSFQRASGVPVMNKNWEDRNFGASGDYGYFVNISLADMMPPYGIKLDRGTNERLLITIRDDCTDADFFNCQSFGFDRFE